jgi:hypothetical protein
MYHVLLTLRADSPPTSEQNGPAAGRADLSSLPAADRARIEALLKDAGFYRVVGLPGTFTMPVTPDLFDGVLSRSDESPDEATSPESDAAANGESSPSPEHAKTERAGGLERAASFVRTVVDRIMQAVGIEDYRAAVSVSPTSPLLLQENAPADQPQANGQTEHAEQSQGAASSPNKVYTSRDATPRPHPPGSASPLREHASARPSRGADPDRTLNGPTSPSETA